MGNHRPLPYDGLHFSKNEPGNGALSAVLTTVISLMVALGFLVGCAFLVTSLQVPVRFTSDGSSVFRMMISMVGGLLS